MASTQKRGRRQFWAWSVRQYFWRRDVEVGGLHAACGTEEPFSSALFMPNVSAHARILSGNGGAQWIHNNHRWAWQAWATDRWATKGGLNLGGLKVWVEMGGKWKRLGWGLEGWRCLVGPSYKIAHCKSTQHSTPQSYRWNFWSNKEGSRRAFLFLENSKEFGKSSRVPYDEYSSMSKEEERALWDVNAISHLYCDETWRKGSLEHDPPQRAFTGCRVQPLKLTIECQLF